MYRSTSFITPIVTFALFSLLWLSSPPPALAATVTDTFPLKATVKEWCRDDPRFVEAIKVKIKDGMTITLQHDDTVVQATINTQGAYATIDAITLHGRILKASKSGLTSQLVLSGRDPGNPDHFLTIRGIATFDKAGNLIKVTGTFVSQITGTYTIDKKTGAHSPPVDCLDSGTFATGATGKKLPPPPPGTGLPPFAQQAYLKASNTDSYDLFGGDISWNTNVALSGDTLAVAAGGESSNATGVNGNQADNSISSSGAVYVFTRTNGIWSQQAYLKPSYAGTETKCFGESIVLSGDTLAVGAYCESSNATGVNGNETNTSARDSGAVYVFTRTNGVWSQQAYLKASNTRAGDEFGKSVALDGDTLAVGAWFQPWAFGTPLLYLEGSHGAVYVFTRTNGVWSQQAFLNASNAEKGDGFGRSVAVSGDTLAVGALDEDSCAIGVNGNQADNGCSDAGAVYVFTRTNGVWSQQAYLKASNTRYCQSFGGSVALSGDTLAVGGGDASALTGVTPGAPTESKTGNGANASGAVYVFTRTGTVWSQQAYLKAPNTDAGDSFILVALEGDTLVVGAPYEDSAATGVNGNQADNSATDSGAVYVFSRANGVWSQKAYLKASNTDSTDLFGSAVALSGNTIVVGAPFESSAATGVNGNQTDNSTFNSGAAYVYVAK